MSHPAPVTTERPAPRTWIDAEQLAERLGVSRRTIYTLTKERRIPYRQLPGTNVIRFAPEDVRAIERMSSVPPTD